MNTFPFSDFSDKDEIILGVTYGHLTSALERTRNEMKGQMRIEIIMKVCERYEEYIQLERQGKFIIRILWRCMGIGDDAFADAEKQERARASERSQHVKVFQGTQEDVNPPALSTLAFATDGTPRAEVCRERTDSRAAWNRRSRCCVTPLIFLHGLQK